MKPLNINTYVLLKESTRENIYSIWVFFLFNICSNFCFKHNCLNSNLKTHCSDTCKASTLVWVRKKNINFSHIRRSVYAWRYVLGRCKVVCNYIVSVLYESRTNFDDDIFPLPRRNIHFCMICRFYLIFFLFSFNEIWWYWYTHMHVCLNVCICSYHDTTRQ